MVYEFMAKKGNKSKRDVKILPVPPELAAKQKRVIKKHWEFLVKCSPETSSNSF